MRLLPPRLQPDAIVTIIDGDEVVLAMSGNQWTSPGTAGSPVRDPPASGWAKGTTRARELEGAQRLIALHPLHVGPAGPGAWVTATSRTASCSPRRTGSLAWNLSALGLVAALALAAALAEGSRR